jgi:hypothetical protein
MAGEHEQSDLPEALKNDLASIYAPQSLDVPSRMDDAILNRARATLAGAAARSRGRRSLRWWAGAATAAACLALAARFTFYHSPVPSEQVDPNHRVNIVDALKLAHQIEAGKGRDVNGDGVIDQRDVDTIAMAAVELDAGGMQ